MSLDDGMSSLNKRFTRSHSCSLSVGKVAGVATEFLNSACTLSLIILVSMTWRISRSMILSLTHSIVTSLYFSSKEVANFLNLGHGPA